MCFMIPNNVFWSQNICFDAYPRLRQFTKLISHFMLVGFCAERERGNAFAGPCCLSHCPCRKQITVVNLSFKNVCFS